MSTLHEYIYKKKDFAKVSKNLGRYRSKNNFVEHQNNHVENSNTMSNSVKNFDILAISLNILHNYFDSLTKLLSDPAKLFFPCNSKMLSLEYRLKNRSFLIIKVIKGDITTDNFFYHKTKKTQL